jgi:hypothetical protein
LLKKDHISFAHPNKIDLSQNSLFVAKDVGNATQRKMRGLENRHCDMGSGEMLATNRLNAVRLYLLIQSLTSIYPQNGSFRGRFIACEAYIRREFFVRLPLRLYLLL